MDCLHHTPSYFSSGCSLIPPRMHLTCGKSQIAVTTLKLVLLLTVSATFFIHYIACLLIPGKAFLHLYIRFYIIFIIMSVQASRAGLSVQAFTFLFSASSKVITFYNKDTRGELQKVTFDNEKVKRIFHGSFHKVGAILYQIVDSVLHEINIEN